MQTHKTAIHRHTASAPVRWLAEESRIVDLLAEARRKRAGGGGYFTVLNFGGGYDIAGSELLGADHYDPNIPDHNTITDYQLQNDTWDLVYSGYVVNVLPDTEARLRHIEELWDMTSGNDWSRAPIVAVRSDRIEGEPYNDGVLTKRGTFQKSYTVKSFRNEFWEFEPQLMHNGGHYLLFTFFSDRRWNIPMEYKLPYKE